MWGSRYTSTIGPARCQEGITEGDGIAATGAETSQCDANDQREGGYFRLLPANEIAGSLPRSINIEFLQVNEVQYALDQQISADRQIERMFRKDFQEVPEDMFVQLHTIAKSWTRTRPSDSILASHKGIDPFPDSLTKAQYLEVVLDRPTAEQPAGCDRPIWQQFLSWYKSKANSENLMIALQGELSEMRCLSEQMTQAHDRCACQEIV
jgi:hypothetical protein